jgi:hypothetical protein
MKAISQKSDALWQLCPRNDQLATIASVESTDDAAGTITGVGQRSAKDRSTRQVATKKTSNKKNVVYCWRHHQFGEKVHSCADPSTCMWAGN